MSPPHAKKELALFAGVVDGDVGMAAGLAKPRSRHVALGGLREMTTQEDPGKGLHVEGAVRPRAAVGEAVQVPLHEHEIEGHRIANADRLARWGRREAAVDVGAVDVSSRLGRAALVMTGVELLEKLVPLIPRTWTWTSTMPVTLPRTRSSTSWARAWAALTVRAPSTLMFKSTNAEDRTEEDREEARHITAPLTHRSTC